MRTQGGWGRGRERICGERTVIPTGSRSIPQLLLVLLSVIAMYFFRYSLQHCGFFLLSKVIQLSCFDILQICCGIGRGPARRRMPGKSKPLCGGPPPPHGEKRRRSGEIHPPSPPPAVAAAAQNASHYPRRKEDRQPDRVWLNQPTPPSMVELALGQPVRQTRCEEREEGTPKH